MRGSGWCLKIKKLSRHCFSSVLLASCDFALATNTLRKNNTTRLKSSCHFKCVSFTIPLSLSTLASKYTHQVTKFCSISFSIFSFTLYMTLCITLQFICSHRQTDTHTHGHTSHFPLLICSPYFFHLLHLNPATSSSSSCTVINFVTLTRNCQIWATWITITNIIHPFEMAYPYSTDNALLPWNLFPAVSC